ncbi:MAG: hypothetical protein LHV68_08730 [Elusimicrobia bacterium]|nr:hypothetical protein [Candidatus Liberimonas magnetica]
MQVKEISVKRHITLPDGQGMDIAVSGCAEIGVDMELAKLELQNVLNSGVLTVLKNEILRPLEEKYSRPVQRQALKAS